MGRWGWTVGVCALVAVVVSGCGKDAASDVVAVASVASAAAAAAVAPSAAPSAVPTASPPPSATSKPHRGLDHDLCDRHTGRGCPVNQFCQPAGETRLLVDEKEATFYVCADILGPARDQCKRQGLFHQQNDCGVGRKCCHLATVPASRALACYETFDCAD